LSPILQNQKPSTYQEMLMGFPMPMQECEERIHGERRDPCQ
jgi:hypothetical protein